MLKDNMILVKKRNEILPIEKIELERYRVYGWKQVYRKRKKSFKMEKDGNTKTVNDTFEIMKKLNYNWKLILESKNFKVELYFWIGSIEYNYLEVDIYNMKNDTKFRKRIYGLDDIIYSLKLFKKFDKKKLSERKLITEREHYFEYESEEEIIFIRTKKLLIFGWDSILNEKVLNFIEENRNANEYIISNFMLKTLNGYDCIVVPERDINELYFLLKEIYYFEFEKMNDVSRYLFE